MTIGVLAQKAGIPVSTLRFYEKKGLLLPQSRTPAGYRRYVEQDVVRARFVKRAQELGFTLREIEALLSLLGSADKPQEELKVQGRKKLEEIDQRLADLSRMRQAMVSLLSEECPNLNRPCPVLESLGGQV